MANRSRIPIVFSIYMLDVICCALGCVILLWQIQLQEAEEQTAAAKQALESWKRASSEVDFVTAEIAALRAELLASKQKNELLSIDIERTANERDEAHRVIAVRKKEYDALLAAKVYSEAILKGVQGDLAKLKDQQKLALLDLAGKVKENAELLLQITAAEKKATDLAKQVTARKIDAHEAARRLQEQLAR